MRALVFLPLLLLLLGSAAAMAEDEPKKAPPKPLTDEQAADAVLAAVKAKDDTALKDLAVKDKPDPWLVADLLCYRGEHDAAEAFAKAAPRVDTEKLPAYVEAWRKREPDKTERELLAAMNGAMSARQPQKVIEGTAALPALDTVVRVRLGHTRGIALGWLQRWAESADLYEQSAAAAEKVGWLTRAARLYGDAGFRAHRGSAGARALSSFGRAHALHQRRGDQAGAAGALVNIGMAHSSLGDKAKALAFYERGLALAEEIGHRQWAANALMNIGSVYAHLGNFPKALANYARALAKQKALGDTFGTASTLVNTGTVYEATGDFAKALAAFEQALAGHKAVGNTHGAAVALGRIGAVHWRLGNYAQALVTLEQTLAEKKALGDMHGAAGVLGTIGAVHSSLGDYPKALATFERALAEKKAMGDRPGAAETLSNIGNVHASLGDYAKALAAYERALAGHKALGDKRGVARALGNIGVVHKSLGDYPKALATYEQALAKMRALGDKHGGAVVLGNIGAVFAGLGDYPKALATYEQALSEKQAAGDKYGAALTRGNIGRVYQSLGDHQKALATYEQALAEQKAMGDKTSAAWTLGKIGTVHAGRGDFVKALAAFERSARAAHSLRATPVFVTAQGYLARLHLQMGKPGRALAAAQKAMDALEGVLGGLGEEQGATAREQFASLFGIGTLAAVREEDAAKALTFLESGRAGALLDALDKREALRWKAESLPPELRRLDLEAQAKESAARHAYDRAAKGGNLKKTRAAAEALDEATEAVRDITGRIQRDLKQQAGLFYPRPKTIDDIRDALEKDQALVLYGLCVDEALALVLRQDGEHIVSLGKASEVATACEALDATELSGDPLAALDALRKLLVDPLKLGKGVKQVLVSPEGPLCYLPFGALFEQTVTMTPSGTTHVLLLAEEREPGKGILALGEPDYGGASKAAQAIYYRGRTLSPLPATRKEVETIGTKTLLGAKASEAGLRDALPTSKRWRAVHFACHGLVDIERPMLSSLALSHAGDDDGFLTALEILRTKIPADLAVLSACETATGKIVKGEGIVGLTRAFMFAGSPRVICSLWKVDDEATKALMVKFYELWNPKDGTGLGAAAALQKAQAYVRDFKDKDGKQKWKHPYYWAAWVLWGLPN